MLTHRPMHPTHLCKQKVRQRSRAAVAFPTAVRGAIWEALYQVANERRLPHPGDAG